MIKGGFMEWAARLQAAERALDEAQNAGEDAPRRSWWLGEARGQITLVEQELLEASAAALRLVRDISNSEGT